MDDLASTRVGAWAIVAGTIMSVTLMIAHPTRLGTMQIGPFDLNVIVHATAVLAMPLLVFGAWTLTKMINRPLGSLALAFYLFAGVAIMSAAIMSGFVMTQISMAANAPGASNTGLDFQSLANLTRWQNRSYANVYTGLSAIAVLLWSIAWRAAPLQRILGIAIGGATLAWMLTGTLTLNIHGMLAVTLGQAVWMLVAARKMMDLAKGSV
ncbi:MAG: hypothetical protein NT015_03005 [Alphaproteobacteria bacterium]|nr:hypothetical protein [Alphaproteobacteria bacterium]